MEDKHQQQVALDNQDKRMTDLEIRIYLEKNVMPLLMSSMEEVAKAKPENPIEFVANYLLNNNPEKIEAEEIKK